VSARFGPIRRRAVALVMTLLLVVLLVAAVGRTAAQSAAAALLSGRRANDLQHRLAVESMVGIVAARLGEDRAPSDNAMDLARSWESITLGECQVTCRVTCDAARLGVAAFSRPADEVRLARKLRTLQQRLALPAVRVQLHPTRDALMAREDPRSEKVLRYAWYDQLFADTDPGAILAPGCFERDAPSGAHPICWSDVVTPFGDGRVDVDAAHPEVLRVLLEDLDPALAGEVLAAETSARRAGLTTALASRDARTRAEVGRRLGAGIPRYALNITTLIRNDVRRWLVVVDVQNGKVNKIHYWSQVQW